MCNNKTCPFFGKCGGCNYDFTADDYHDKKLLLLRQFSMTDAPIWIPPYSRRRAEFCFSGGNFGFFRHHSKDIIAINHCPLLCPELNAILPRLRELPWIGSGECLLTLCDNGIDVGVNANIPYCTPEFRNASTKLPVIRVSWNGRVIHQTDTPVISFGAHKTEYPIGAFLQPTIISADIMREMVQDTTRDAHRVADLFCGLGNFTFATNADGFDIVGTGMTRDLFRKPLTQKMLAQYDCVIIDPPRAGADAQCTVLAKSNVARIVYISCNPQTFARDAKTLAGGGYKIVKLTPVDQFIGSNHWELFAVFDKEPCSLCS